MNQVLIDYASTDAVNLYMFSRLLHIFLCCRVVILANTCFYLFTGFYLALQDHGCPDNGAGETNNCCWH